MPHIGEMMTRTCVKCGREFDYEYRGGRVRDLHPDTGPGATECRMFKSNDERAAREKKIRDEAIAAGIKAGLREAVADRLREILPERQDELDRAQKFRISPNGFIIDVDEATRRRMLVRLHEAQASANRLLSHGRDKRKAVALMLSYRSEMEEKFLPLLRRFIWLFDDE